MSERDLGAPDALGRTLVRMPARDLFRARWEEARRQFLKPDALFMQCAFVCVEATDFRLRDLSLHSAAVWCDFSFGTPK